MQVVWLDSAKANIFFTPKKLQVVLYCPMKKKIPFNLLCVLFFIFINLLVVILVSDFYDETICQLWVCFAFFQAANRENVILHETYIFLKSVETHFCAFGQSHEDDFSEISPVHRDQLFHFFFIRDQSNTQRWSVALTKKSLHVEQLFAI